MNARKKDSSSKRYKRAPVRERRKGAQGLFNRSFALLNANSYKRDVLKGIRELVNRFKEKKDKKRRPRLDKNFLNFS